MSESDFDKVRNFYNEQYHGSASAYDQLPSWHYEVVARRLGNFSSRKVLDIACGKGAWLSLLRKKGATVAGVDISEKAIDYCVTHIPEGTFIVSPAEKLALPSDEFDYVTCLGSLEHFLDQRAALEEMVRVGKSNAWFLILVPNAGFLTRRLGLYGGTQQTRIKEDVRSLRSWEELLAEAGLVVTARWRDLHPLSKDWIFRGKPLSWLVRMLQALALPVWPIGWQYQVYHLCKKSHMR